MSASGLEHYLAEFNRVEAALPGRRVGWLAHARRQALDHFAQAGFPTLRQEDWKYTSVAALEKSRFAVALPQAGDGLDAAVAAQIEALALAGAHLLVFVNGAHQPQWSRIGALPVGLELASLAATLDRAPDCLEGLLTRRASDYPSGFASGFAALNMAFMTDGAYIRVAAGTVTVQPIHLLFLATAGELATHARNLVVAQAAAESASSSTTRAWMGWAIARIPSLTSLPSAMRRSNITSCSRRASRPSISPA